MDHRFGFIEVQRKSTFKGPAQAPTKNQHTAKRCPMKKLPKPGEGAFNKQKSRGFEEGPQQQFSFFGQHQMIRTQKKLSESDDLPAETMSRKPIEPEEEELNIFEPKMSKWIEPSDDELEPLPDVPEENIWKTHQYDDSF